MLPPHRSTRQTFTTRCSVTVRRIVAEHCRVSSVEVRAPSRRERLRAEASQEIKAIALRLMTEGGPAAISLRAIAREMGMTAGALYGYYATRDDLINALIAEVYSSLADAEEAAGHAVP